MADVQKVPFLLAPAGKDYIWGGRRLKDDFCKNFPDLTPLAETWECSTHPDGLSKAASGPFAGKTLREVLTERPDFLGSHAASLSREAGDLPILVKFIDAKENLSVQVHPDDEYAYAHEGGRGKTEMWYCVDAAKGAKLVYGFRHTVTKEKVLDSLRKNRLELLLQYVPIEKDDVFFVSPGTVHAIGAGALVAEIQESSNLTYRVYDYGRLGKDGRPRELHVEKALDVMKLSAREAPRQPMRTLRFHPGYATELIGSCRYFLVERLLLNTERVRSMACLPVPSTTFEVLMVTDGCGMISCGKETFPFFRGDTVFVPAASPDITLHGRATILRIGC